MLLTKTTKDDATYKNYERRRYSQKIMKDDVNYKNYEL